MKNYRSQRLALAKKLRTSLYCHKAGTTREWLVWEEGLLLTSPSIFGPGQRMTVLEMLRKIRDIFPANGGPCSDCEGEGLVELSYKEWLERFAVPKAEYDFKAPETMKTCETCKGKGV